MTRTDLQLITLVADGNEGAYGELYRRHFLAAQRRANQLTPSRTDAEDLVSEAFVNVFYAIRRGCRPNQFRPYLFTAIRRKARWLYIRQSRARVVSLNDDRSGNHALIDLPSPTGDPATMVDVELLRLAFRSLPPRWRAALWLSAVEARTPAELAPMLNLTPKAVAALTCRARRGLLRAHAKLTTNSLD